MTLPGHSTGTARAETGVDRGPERRPTAQRAVVPAWPRLLSVELAAAYVGLNVEILREYVRSGRLAPIRPPRPDTARSHGYRSGSSRRTVANDTVRRLLFDRADLDAMVDSWKANEIRGEASRA